MNFVTIASWDEMAGFLMAFVVFLSTLKFLSMLKFNRRLNMMTYAIGASANDVKLFMITFAIYFLAFVQLAYMLFGSQLSYYSNLSQTIQTLFQLTMGVFTWSDLINAQPVLGPVFFFLFIFVVFFGLQSMFLVIICDAFANVRASNMFERNEYEVIDYIVGKLTGGHKSGGE